MLAHFYKADVNYGTALTKAVKGDIKTVKAVAATL
jgi:catalase